MSIISFIKSLFSRKKVKALDGPKFETTLKNKNDDFINSLKITPTKTRPKKGIETLTCEGDGLRNPKQIKLLKKERF